MAMELKHIEFNLTIYPDDGKLLSRAAELNLQMKRFDRALNYYEHYLSVFPDDSEIVVKKDEVKKNVAKDLLILVENKNALVLWEDLEKVVIDRLGVFKAMAELLRKNKKENLLADILIIIRNEEPGDENISRELVLLLLKLNRTDEMVELVPDYQMYLP
jgi:tetratricopeptide (TPR) repeat protein